MPIPELLGLKLSRSCHCMRNIRKKTNVVGNRYAEAARSGGVVKHSLDQLNTKVRDLVAAGDSLLAAGDRENRLRTYREALTILEKLAANNAVGPRSLLAIH